MKNKFGIVLSLFCAFCLFAQLYAKDWPNWRGPNLDGNVTAEVFKADFGLKIAWRKPLGSGYSGISAVSDHAVTMFSDSTDDYVISFNPDSGNEQWRFKLDSTYAGHDGSNNGPISTPLVADGKVFALDPRGQFVALSLEDGKKIWATNLPEDHSAVVPNYGFATAPLSYGDNVIIETGGSRQNTISAFNRDTGKLVWSVGTDTVHYQSPMLFDFGGETHLVCAGDKYLYGVNPDNGKMLWQYNHKTGAQAMNPVHFNNGRLFFGTRTRQATAIQLKKEGEGYTTTDLWNTNQLARTFAPTVFHDGALYGYSGRFLTAIDAATGERVWRSRPPGDGFVIVVDGHLVIMTKQGTLHVSKADREGYEELAALQVFSGLTWTPPSFSNGRLFARNLFEVAAIDIVPADQVIAADLPAQPQVGEAGQAPKGSKFAKFIAKVNASDNKKQLIDEFMAKQKSFPVIEGKKYAHIIHRGEVKDVAVGGDMMDLNVEQPNASHRGHKLLLFFD